MSLKHNIIRSLLDKYENSQLSKGGTLTKKRIMIKMTGKLFANYWSNDSYLYREKINREIEDLVSRKLIFAEYDNDLPFLLVLNLSSLDEAFSFVNRIPQKTVNNNIKKFIEESLIKTSNNNTLINFCESMIIRINAYESTAAYFDNLDDLKTVVKIVDGIFLQEEDILLRNFSKRTLGDSKLLEKYRYRILRLFNDFSGKTYESFYDLCSEYNIYKNTTYAFLKNGLVFKINDQIIDLDKLKTEISLSDHSVDDMEILSLSRTTVITVENLTTFNYLDMDALIIYLGGFHNSIKRNLILKIHHFIPTLNWYHFGDIDVNGFVILEDLKDKTGIDIKPLFMDINQLEKYKNQCQKLTENDIKRLRLMLEEKKYEKYHSVITFMLKENIKLEQESIE